MADIYQITLTTQTGETFTGKISRRHLDFFSSFLPMSTQKVSSCNTPMLA